MVRGDAAREDAMTDQGRSGGTPPNLGATVVVRSGTSRSGLVDTTAATVIARPQSERDDASAASSPSSSAASRVTVRAQEAVMPSAATTSVPAPRLDISEVIGVGGMGIVYRARQAELERPIAFKRLIDAPTEEMRARFVREARLTAQLDHPNIVPVHLLDPGSDGEPSGYAMKLVEGKTLSTLIREARERVERGDKLGDEHSLDTRLEHFLKVCDAIAFAHDRGVIHRDLKPANVMIGSFGAVYVMDWGIARPIGRAGAADDVPRVAHAAASSGGAGELTRYGALIGSPQYMSPEQAQGKNDELDGRSDQYALGLLLHELVSLIPAVNAPSELAAVEAATRGEKTPLHALDTKPGRAPKELRAIVAKATALSPDARYPSVRELADDVRRFLHGDAVHALPEGPLGRLLRFMSRHRRTTLLAFVGVIFAASLALSITRYRQAARELAVRERGAELTAFYSEVARQGHRIDTQLLQLEEALEGLSTAAEWALTNPEPADPAPIYFDTDFADPARRPADFTDATKYRWPISVDHMVVGVAPTTDRTELLSQIRRVLPLAEHMRQMIVRAAVGERAEVSPAEARRILLERESPIDYAYIDLPSGVHIMWPGMAALPPGYDVRTAGFYQISDHQRGKRWGAPYIDSTTDEKGDDLVLPCTEGLWSPSGEFLGVAGVEITVTKMVETSMVLPSRTTLRTSLLDEQGRKIIDSNDAGKRLASSGKDEALEFQDFDLPAVSAAIRNGEEGLRELTRNGRRILVAFVRLDALGWYYVVETDAATLGKR
jgi:serine/threonine protein kinase